MIWFDCFTYIHDIHNSVCEVLGKKHWCDSWVKNVSSVFFFFNSKGELKSKHEVKLKEKIFDAYGERWKDDEIDKNINKHLHNVKKCMEHRDLVGDQRFGSGWGYMAQYNFFSGLEKGHIIYIFFYPSFSIYTMHI